jgi:hypothetical protein
MKKHERFMVLEQQMALRKVKPVKQQPQIVISDFDKSFIEI